MCIFPCEVANGVSQTFDVLKDRQRAQNISVVSHSFSVHLKQSNMLGSNYRTLPHRETTSSFVLTSHRCFVLCVKTNKRQERKRIQADICLLPRVSNGAEGRHLLLGVNSCRILGCTAVEFITQPH
jgi:hypothetical protein